MGEIEVEARPEEGYPGGWRGVRGEAETPRRENCTEPAMGLVIKVSKGLHLLPSYLFIQPPDDNIWQQHGNSY